MLETARILVVDDEKLIREILYRHAVANRERRGLHDLARFGRDDLRPEQTAGAGVRVDPIGVTSLASDTQYAVTVTAIGGTIVAIVEELASGGDSAMIYEGFAAP